MRRALVAMVATLVFFSSSPVAAGDGGYDAALEALLPRVVKLYGLGTKRQVGYGTGLIVSPDGKVLTVFTLLIDARRIRAVTADGTTFEARVLHRDRDLQLALLQLVPVSLAPETSPARDETEQFDFFDLSKESPVEVGDWLVAAGNAFKVAGGSEPVSVAHGLLSTRMNLDARRRLRDFPFHGEVLVIDAITSNPGVPGSPVVNLSGELVGMIGRIVTSNLTHTRINYALPRKLLFEFFESANIDGDSSTSTLAATAAKKRLHRSESAPVDTGIRLSRLGYQRKLPFVEKVRRGSVGHQAGVRADDLILSVNGRSVADVAAYDKRMRLLSRGEPINLVLRRGREILTVHMDAPGIEVPKPDGQQDGGATP